VPHLEKKSPFGEIKFPKKIIGSISEWEERKMGLIKIKKHVIIKKLCRGKRKGRMLL
jgi:hypothetical protein